MYEKDMLSEKLETCLKLKSQFEALANAEDADSDKFDTYMYMAYTYEQKANQLETEIELLREREV